MQNDEKGILRCNVLHVNILNSYFIRKDWCNVKSGENHHNMFKFSEKRKLLTHLSKTSQYFQNIFSRFPTFFVNMMSHKLCTTFRKSLTAYSLKLICQSAKSRDLLIFDVR